MRASRINFSSFICNLRFTCSSSSSLSPPTLASEVLVQGVDAELSMVISEDLFVAAQVWCALEVELVLAWECVSGGSGVFGGGGDAGNGDFGGGFLIDW